MCRPRCTSNEVRGCRHQFQLSTDLDFVTYAPELRSAGAATLFHSMVLGEGGLAELSGCKDSVMRKRPRPAYVVNKQRFCGFHTNAFVAFTCVRDDMSHP